MGTGSSVTVCPTCARGSSTPFAHEARLSHLGTRLVYPAWSRGSSIPLGHEARLSRLGTRLIYPTWARARLSHLGTGSSIPPGHDAFYPTRARARLSRLGTRLVYPAWARGSSVLLGLRLNQAERLAAHPVLVLAAHPGREAHALSPSFGGTSCRHPACAGLEPAKALWLTFFTGARVELHAMAITQIHTSTIVPDRRPSLLARQPIIIYEQHLHTYIIT